MGTTMRTTLNTYSTTALDTPDWVNLKDCLRRLPALQPHEIAAALDYYDLSPYDAREIAYEWNLAMQFELERRIEVGDFGGVTRVTYNEYIDDTIELAKESVQSLHGIAMRTSDQYRADWWDTKSTRAVKLGRHGLHRAGILPRIPTITHDELDALVPGNEFSTTDRDVICGAYRSVIYWAMLHRYDSGAFRDATKETIDEKFMELLNEVRADTTLLADIVQYSTDYSKAK